MWSATGTMPDGSSPPSMSGPDRPGRPLGGRKPLFLSLIAAAALSGCATAPGPASPALPGSVARFLDRNGWDLSGYESSDIASLDGFFFHRRTYASPAPPERVWNAYMTLDPSEAWNTPRTRPGVLWDPAAARMYRPPDPAPAFSVGQVYVIEIKILGFLRIPASFRITRIDEPELLIEFVYLERNLSNGVQRLRFLERAGPGGGRSTVIEHTTWYRSGRSFRDRALYGPVHARIIDGFHEGVFRRSGLPLETGAVTVTVYADSAVQGTLEVLPSAGVDARKGFEYVPGLWRFEASAADGSAGSLYIEIEDR